MSKIKSIPELFNLLESVKHAREINRLAIQIIKEYECRRIERLYGAHASSKDDK